jgi:hypothetical protein
MIKYGFKNGPLNNKPYPRLAACNFSAGAIKMNLIKSIADNNRAACITPEN